LSGYRHRAFVSGPLPVAVRVPSPNDPVMESAAMVRVYCADGPCQGEQYICLENGTILFDDNP